MKPELKEKLTSIIEMFERLEARAEYKCTDPANDYCTYGDTQRNASDVEYGSYLAYRHCKEALKYEAQQLLDALTEQVEAREYHPTHVHLKSKGEYMTTGEGKVQINGKWRVCVFYENSRGEKYCRTFTDFMAKFDQLSTQDTNTP